MDELSEDSLRRPKLNASPWEALGNKEFLETCPVERHPTSVSAAWGVGMAFLCKVTPYAAMMPLAKPGHEEYNVYR